MPQNYIEYVSPQVAFYDAGTQARDVSGEIDPGGAETVVAGTYYSWETAEGGFTGTGWWGASVEDGPTGYWGFTNDEDVIAYINEIGNLNAVFSNWQTYINGQPAGSEAIVVSHFNEALINAGGSGCMQKR